MSYKTYPVLVTINRNYISPLIVMLRSLLRAEPEAEFSVYILHSSLDETDIRQIETQSGSARCTVHAILAQDALLKEAPVTSRYPLEMYYRIFAARFLPEHLDRVLYLDPDLVVINPIRPLFDIKMDGHLFAAASHVQGPMQKINEMRLDMEECTPYINTGVMLMNLDYLRREQDYEQVYQYIRKYRKRLLLPDQDVISGLYASRIFPLDPYIYNMTERLFLLRTDAQCWRNLDWVRTNSAIIHYCGRNKPWKKNYKGKLDVFWHENAQTPLPDKSV